MIGILVATHGNFAEGLIHGAELLGGKQEKLLGMGLCHGDSIEEFEEKMKINIGTLDDGDGVLVLVDIAGGSPANIAFKCMRLSNKINALTSVNMPMLLEAIFSRDGISLEELCNMCIEVGKEAPAEIHKEFAELKIDDSDDEEF